MIGKVGVSGSVRTLLNYCYYESTLKRQRGKNDNFKFENVRGEYIYSQNLDVLLLKDRRIDMDAIIAQFENITSLNRNCTKPLWHESFSFPLEEKPSNELLFKIITDFSDAFGFNERQLIAFRHYDKSHHHFHIIANRLDFNGKNAIKTSKNFKKTNDFCRETEKKYDLVPFKMRDKFIYAEIAENKQSKSFQQKRLNRAVRESNNSSLSQVGTLKYPSIFDVSQNANTETEKDLFKINSNLSKFKSADSQGIRPFMPENAQKSRKKP